MAFQGQQGPDMISLALNLMQMRRENEFNERKFKLEEAKLAQQAQLDAIQAQRDQAEWILKMQKDQLDLDSSKLDFDNTMTEREKALAPTLNAANDPRLGMSAQQTAANQFVRGIEEQIAAGRSPTMVGGNAGAEAAAMLAKKLDVRDVKDEDASRSFRWAEKSAEAAARRQLRINEEKARIEAELEKSGGLFTGEALRATRTMFKEEIKPAIANEKAWGFYERFNPTNRQQIIDAVQLAQRAIDPVNVTEGDMRLRVAAGLDSQGALLRRMEEWSTGAIAIPKELGQVIKDNLREKLENADDQTFMTFEEHERYVNDNGLDDAQRNFVLTDRALAERVRKRVAKRRSDASATSASTPNRARRRPAGVLSPEEAAAEGLPE